MNAPGVSTVSEPFETVSSLRIESDAPNASENDDGEADEAYHEHSKIERDEEGDRGIKGDEIIQDLELHFALWVCSAFPRKNYIRLKSLQDLETTCAKVKTYWADAALGKMPVMLAGFLTNAVMSSVAWRFRSQQRFFETSELFNCDVTFVERKSSELSITKAAENSNPIATSSFTQDMEVTLLAIALCQQETNLETEQPLETIIEKPQDYITPLEEPCECSKRTDNEITVFKSLLRSIKQLPLSEARTRLDFVMGIHPYIDKLDLHGYNKKIPTAPTFVLRLIIESYKSWYINPGGRQDFSNPRLYVLRFAQDVHKKIRDFRLSKPFEPRGECDCSDCANPGLMERLHRFEEKLASFIYAKRFDLYHQSPVVAGYQMAEILAGATSLGLYFVNISQYVGVIIHLYNLLRQLNLIGEEPVLLEYLCHATGATVFRGSRPTMDFYSQYAAFQRMTLEYNKKKRSFEFGDPKSHKRRINPDSVSVMTGLNDTGFGHACRLWVSVWRGKHNVGRLTNKEILDTFNQIDAHPLVCTLEPLESIVRSEWEGKFPVPRINWFEVFTCCTEVLRKISDVECGDPRDLECFRDSWNRDASFHYGKVEVEALIKHAQELDRDEFLLEWAEQLRTARNAIRETFKGKKSSATRRILLVLMAAQTRRRRIFCGMCELTRQRIPWHVPEHMVMEPSKE